MQCSKSSDDLLCNVVQHFFKGNITFSLQVDDVDKMDWSWQQQFLDSTINSKLLKKYPVSKKFTKLFLKKLIEYIELYHEVHDDIYSQLCTTMQDSENDIFCYRHYMIENNLESIVTIKETRNMVVNGTTGLRTWEAALMLSDWALCNQELFLNKNVLELGSGVGFTGITIGKLCKVKTITMTDCHHEVLKTIGDNIRINFPSFEYQDCKNMSLFRGHDKSLGVMMLDWNEIDSLPDHMLPDILIGADIVYDPCILTPLCKVIHTFCCRNKNLEAYIASVIRNEDTFKGFLKTLEAMDFDYEEIKLSKNVFVEWDQTVSKCLLKIKLKGK